MSLEKIHLCGLSTSDALVSKVAEILGVEKKEVVSYRFANGEQLIYPQESVRGSHVFVVQSTCPPASDNLMELLIFINALKMASAKEITVVIPFFGYSRQDRKSLPRQPITARLIADLLETAGANRIISFDFHTPQLQGFFSKPTDNIPVKKLFAKHFSSMVGKDLVIVSPDHGGVARAQEVASLLGATLAILDKRRPRKNEAEVANIIGYVKDKHCIIIDDMIDTGGTIISGIDALLGAGAKDVRIAATHPIFSGDAIEKLERSPAKEIVVTDSITFNKKSDKIKVVSIAELLAEVVKNIELGIPVSTVF
jgi:ribose-phosphate pyrophosphokinase